MTESTLRRKQPAPARAGAAAKSSSPAGSTAEGAAPALGRRERARQSTRARLLAAALELMGMQGPENTSIADITQRADVGFGTFYSYFDSKDAILAAAIDTVAEQLGAAIESATATLDDPALALSAILRHLVAWAGDNQAAGRFLVEVGMGQSSARRHLGDILARQYERGRDAGRFDARINATARPVVGGAVRATIAAMLDGSVDGDPSAPLSAQVL